MAIYTSNKISFKPRNIHPRECLQQNKHLKLSITQVRMNTYAIETRILSPVYINSLQEYFGLNIALPLTHEISRVGINNS